MKPYVTSALKSGIVQGSSTETGQLVFSAQSPVSRAEAAVILDQVLNISDAVSGQTDGAVPAWAQQAVVNLESCGVSVTGGSGLADPMNRAEVAELLSEAMDILEARAEENSFFSWSR